MKNLNTIQLNKKTRIF